MDQPRNKFIAKLEEAARKAKGTAVFNVFDQCLKN